MMFAARLLTLSIVLPTLLAGCQGKERPAAATATTAATASANATSFSERYEFKGGYPTDETAQRAHDSLDLNRALSAYRFFYPTVSGAAIFAGTAKVGVVPNKKFGYMDTQPKHVGYTLNSDTPYGAVLLDLHAGPMVIDVPPGPLLGAALDYNQRWIADMGIPGPDAGKGGKHLILPPDFKGNVPRGYYVSKATSFRVVGGMRSIPEQGDLAGAIERLKSVKAYPLNKPTDWTDPIWFDMTPQPQDTTPHSFEESIEYWRVLHQAVTDEPPLEDSRSYYGDLAALGIVKGQPFNPDERMTRILEQAAKIGSAQMRAEAFADNRADRVVWPDRQWQWASLRFENGSFDAADYRDTYAIDKWFYQAIAASPAMFRRDTSAGSLYWLGLRDGSGAYLDGGKTYKLTVPLPVPARLFWSVTVYDAITRSQIQTDQAKAALRSLFELKELSGDSVDLYFGPKAPAGQESRWIQTLPERGWFVYFRIYGPQGPAFDASWKPGDFVEVNQSL
ncbi:hypothetical protein HNQ60_004694 [Povalibacter uvarum]|uniref:DUF1254 domain-containing protein n=1 Tax=Povalibacter uvarum TaxID=732238 RepID=A0A841HSP7_9GAMM|nr:DUF1254 domain-containing protein [Povalibacter uvarum]MBB6095803.1 hypothetical protein [Povalibacter uvarum]